MEPNAPQSQIQTQTQPPAPTPDPTPQSPFVVSPIEQPRSKKPLLVGLAVTIGVIALVFIGLAVWSSSARKSYATAAGAYKTAITAEYKAMEMQPENTEAYITYLEKHHTALGKIIDTTPKKKTILWASGASPADETTVRSLTTATAELRAAVQQYHTFLIYRDNLLLAKRGSGGTVSTIDNMRTTVVSLEKTQKDVKALEPPSGLEDYHKKQVDSYTAPIADIKAALAAYDKGDTDTYTKEVKELAASAKGISSLGNTAEALLAMHDYYDQLAEKYAQLESIVLPKSR